ncbi:MAG: phosphoribosylanthranilate isomerase, partial [Nannocystaceae bacterium]
MTCSLKICGVTRVEDVLACRAAGVQAIGLNFWSGSKRAVTPAQARRLTEAARAPGEHPPLTAVGVFVDHTPEQARAVAVEAALDMVQPHGDAPPERFANLGIPWIWVVRGTPALASLRAPTPAP